MKIAHFTSGVVRLLFVIVTAQPPVTGREADGAEVVPGRDAEVDRTRGGRRGARRGRAVLDRVGEVRLFGGHQVPKVRLHRGDRKSTRLNSSHSSSSYAVFGYDHNHDQQLNECETLAV